MRQMIEEAEQQMNSMCDYVKQEQKAEYEKIIKKMRSEYEAEIAGFNEIIEKMQEVKIYFTLIRRITQF
jgi:hypothetical protein